MTFFAILSHQLTIHHPGPVSMKWNKNVIFVNDFCSFGKSKWKKIHVCVSHGSLCFWFLHLIPWLPFIVIFFRAKLASCCDAVQNFIVSQNNTPVGTNMSYEVERKNAILIRKNIFNMFPVVSKDLLWFICVIVPGEFSLTSSYNLW